MKGAFENIHMHFVMIFQRDGSGEVAEFSKRAKHYYSATVLKKIRAKRKVVKAEDGNKQAFNQFDIFSLSLE